eukprot:3662494-Rhodomonas_salina.2
MAGESRCGHRRIRTARWVNSAICLRVCYAMSGTDLAYGAICLRISYASSALAPSAYVCYARCCTDIEHGPTSVDGW